MIFDDIKEIQGHHIIESFMQEVKEDKKGQEDKEGNYCKIDFEGLLYEFDSMKNNSDDLLYQEILDKRNVDRKLSKKRFFSKKKEKSEQKDPLQEKKERIKRKGIITTDINIVELLIKDVIDQYNHKIQILKKTI